MAEGLAHALVAVSPTRPQWALVGILLTTILVMMIWERRRPAYAMDHQGTWKRDIGAALISAAIILPTAAFINRYLSFTPILPAAVFTLPFALRFLLFVVIGDFCYYWVHRLMHTRWLWSIHRWHHSPTYMYWFMGTRGSLFQIVLVNIPYFFAQALFEVSPWWTGLAIVLKNVVQNNWMHLNVRWGPRWLERFIVTPRYHHIHHSDNPEYYGSNVAAIFPVWDRLFGTYRDPDSVPEQLGFGTNERAASWRLAIGV